MIISKQNFVVYFVIISFFILSECQRFSNGRYNFMQYTYMQCKKIEKIWCEFSVRLVERRKRIMRRRMDNRHKLKLQVCFELVGCFINPSSRLPLKHLPEHPDVIKTKFLLYTRDERQIPENLEYEDDSRSMEKSRFNIIRHVKIIIHGYKGSGTDEGAILGAKSFLNVEDANVIILDWTRGANTTYKTAVANTELVGRQLALILLDMINLGTDPKKIHIIGFSLGAHVAGCASEELKKKNLLIGRITGLDPASPFFKHHLFRERSKKLDASDASLVDVIHTDGSEVFTDGFGLLKPIGHVDFFPNGGKEQPGCTDTKNSVIVSHFNKGSLDRKIACSHLRAWILFVESIQSQSQKCKFVAWPCLHGVSSFTSGTCFPQEMQEGLQEMGYSANHGPQGIFYLATRAEKPYCGEPLKAVVITSEGAPKTIGTLYFRIQYKNSSTSFHILCNLSNQTNRQSAFYDIAAAEFQSFSNDNAIQKIQGTIWYQAVINNTKESSNVESITTTLRLDRLAIEDKRGNRWEYCEMPITISEEVNIELFNSLYTAVNC